MAETPHMMACPACDVAPLARLNSSKSGIASEELQLSLPTVHCAACISKVERALNSHDAVQDARVNLTLKRALVKLSSPVEIENIIRVVNGVGYEAFELDAAMLAGEATDQVGRALLMRLGVAGFAMMNVMLLSVAVWSGATEATRDMFHWISAAIALPTVAFSGQPFYRNAWSAVSKAQLNMDVPISLAILLAAGMSVYETANSGEHAYFDAALSLTFFLLAGRYLDHRTRRLSRSAAQELAAMEVQRAIREDGTTALVSDILPGDLIRVFPGDRVPVDGTIAVGETELDRSLLTGESLPVSTGPNGAVYAGDINLTGVLTVRAGAKGQDSTLRRLADLVALAETSRNRYTSLADKAARIYAPLVHLLALLAFAFWVWHSGDMRLALNISVAVLIITCPCALGLAVPAVSTAASGRLFRQGMLIKSPTALERLAETDTVVFDKTGTLTMGHPKLISGLPDEPMASVAFALAKSSAHPLARALAEASEQGAVTAAQLDSVQELPGHGVSGTWNGVRVRLGRPDWLGFAEPKGTLTCLQIGDQDPVPFYFRDSLRPGAKEAVSMLRKSGNDVVLLSGDTDEAVAEIAAELGIPAWEGAMRPDDKAGRIAVMSKAGRKVLMVGDGLNDTAALASAHVSISPASGLEAARVVSDIVLLGHSLAEIPEAISVARAATARIRENFAIAALYNLVAIPIALAGFATPLAAALAMSGSSISVSLNALRLVRR